MKWWRGNCCCACCHKVMKGSHGHCHSSLWSDEWKGCSCGVTGGKMDHEMMGVSPCCCPYGPNSLGAMSQFIYDVLQQLPPSGDHGCQSGQVRGSVILWWMPSLEMSLCAVSHGCRLHRWQGMVSMKWGPSHPPCLDLWAAWPHQCQGDQNNSAKAPDPVSLIYVQCSPHPELVCGHPSMQVSYRQWQS